MANPVPFCERCGRPGATLSGVHPGAEGLIAWTLFRCGHMRAEIVLDDQLDDQGDEAIPSLEELPADLKASPPHVCCGRGA